jgi:DNA-binding transcriptional LysR family regulator
VELRHLRYFVAVAEEGHFGRAAERLHIAQPPLSRQIRALEDELGFALFDRSRRTIEVTPAGRVFLARVRRVFEMLEGSVIEARRASKGELGRIAVGYPSSVAYSGLTEMLRAFRERSPSVALVLREMPPQDQIVALKEGRLDVGFVRGPLEEPTLAAEPVRTEPLVVALPDGHPLASRRRIALAELAREPFVSFPRARGPSFFDLLMRLCHQAGFTPNIVQEAPQLDMVSLVAAGFGVAIVPRSMRHVRHEGLVYRPLENAPITTLLVAWRPENRSPVLRDFLEVVRRVFASS